MLTPTARYGTYSTVHTVLLHTNSSNACGVTERPLGVAGALLLVLLLLLLQDTVPLLTVLAQGWLYIHRYTHTRYMTSESKIRVQGALHARLGLRRW
jgi:hypothetical protein